MKGSRSLTKILRECPDLWLGSSKSANPQQNLLSTGYSLLDQRLNNSGWPQAGLIEVFASLLGIGEIRLFTPALKELINNKKTVVWINPPFIPHPLALNDSGLKEDSQLIVFARNQKDLLWAIEASCTNEKIGAVLAWTKKITLSARHSRRLQLSAKSAGTLCCLFRATLLQHEASMSELKIALSPSKNFGFLKIDIIKHRGGSPQKGIEVEIDPAGSYRKFINANKLAPWHLHQPALEKNNTDIVNLSNSASTDLSADDTKTEYLHPIAPYPLH